MSHSGNGITDWYKKAKKYTQKVHNPSYGKTHEFNLHFRLLICGGSGTKKTHTLIELIHRMSGTFSRLVLCVRSADEPLYKSD
jgi:hypothetical protein